ncbi:permease [Ancylomarina euxinus]|uniref:Permease n=1 Tax=Ancylomarina euxinus TaxID=2283627 RepID=A0A425Y6V6_9BACT|nr:permease [Ancylomarina euxinus]MCZ4693940.1 permease [Ancylomarina euxinus]MUP14639.1 permease [Ancylomarina euxinus]RRG24184.1 permease [Ancylomarina euxinus]
MIKSIQITNKKQLFSVLILLPVWCLLYINLQSISDFLIDSVFQMPKSHLSETLRFFIFEVPKVILLLVLVIFGVGIIRSYFSPEKTKQALAGKSTFMGNIMAALLGVLTPFCSCSAIPLFLGFVEAGVPLGVTFSFLIAAPMVNEIALIMLVGLFGWKTAIIYTLTGLLIAIFAGWIIGVLKLEKYIQEWVFEVKTGQSGLDETKISFSDRIKLGFETVKEIVGKIWLYIVIGVAIGAAAHGYVPEDFMANLMGKSAWYSVPLSILIGIPMYSNAAGIIPIVSVLIEKGASLGTALAFMMSVIGLSLPEIIILKKVLKMPLILIFIGVVATGILAVGFIFNIFF